MNKQNVWFQTNNMCRLLKDDSPVHLDTAAFATTLDFPVRENVLSWHNKSILFLQYMLKRLRSVKYISSLHFFCEVILQVRESQEETNQPYSFYSEKQQNKKAGCACFRLIICLTNSSASIGHFCPEQNSGVGGWLTSISLKKYCTHQNYFYT